MSHRRRKCCALPRGSPPIFWGLRATAPPPSLRPARLIARSARHQGAPRATRLLFRLSSLQLPCATLFHLPCRVCRLLVRTIRLRGRCTGAVVHRSNPLYPAPPSGTSTLAPHLHPRPWLPPRHSPRRPPPPHPLRRPFVRFRVGPARLSFSRSGPAPHTCLIASRHKSSSLLEFNATRVMISWAGSEPSPPHCFRLARYRTQKSQSECSELSPLSPLRGLGAFSAPGC